LRFTPKDVGSRQFVVHATRPGAKLTEFSPDRSSVIGGLPQRRT
jgi:hypothetical protein